MELRQKQNWQPAWTRDSLQRDTLSLHERVDSLQRDTLSLHEHECLRGECWGTRWELALRARLAFIAWKFRSSYVYLEIRRTCWSRTFTACGRTRRENSGQLHPLANYPMCQELFFGKNTHFFSMESHQSLNDVSWTFQRNRSWRLWLASNTPLKIGSTVIPYGFYYWMMVSCNLENRSEGSFLAKITLNTITSSRSVTSTACVAVVLWK